MKKLICSILIAALLINPFFTRQAEAAVPLIPALYTGTAALLAAGGVYYAKASSRITTIDPVGTIRRNAMAAYVTLEAVSGAQRAVLKEVAVQAKLTVNQIKSLAASNPTAYPSTAAAAAVAGTYPEATNTAGIYPAGSKISVNGVNYETIGASSWCPNPNIGIKIPNPVAVTSDGSGLYIYATETSAGSQQYRWVAIYILKAPSSPPVPRPATNTEMTQNLSGLTSPPSGIVSVSPTYQDEIDAMLKDPNYVPAFDDDKGLPYTPPASVPTAGELEDAERKAGVVGHNTAVQQAAQAQQQAAQSQVTVADSALQTAQSNYNTAAANAAANPNDPNAQAALTAAKQALDDAQAKKDAATAALAQANVKAQQATDNPYPTTSNDALKSFSWEKWKSLIGVMSSKFPFNLIGTLSDYVNLFITDGQAPRFALPVMSWTINVNLSMFDPVAACLRWAIGIILTLGIVQRLINFWRGVS